MKDDTHAAAEAAAGSSLRKGRHTFVVNAGRDMLETEFAADDFEVAPEGVHFVRDKDLETEHVFAFVSHPCIVRMDDDGAAAATREPGK